MIFKRLNEVHKTSNTVETPVGAQQMLVIFVYCWNSINTEQVTEQTNEWTRGTKCAYRTFHLGQMLSNI